MRKIQRMALSHAPNTGYAYSKRSIHPGDFLKKYSPQRHRGHGGKEKEKHSAVKTNYWSVIRCFELGGTEYLLSTNFNLPLIPSCSSSVRSVPLQ
jgi:hypothetical protein